MTSWYSKGSEYISCLHTLPSIKSWVPILTTVHPMALAELRQSVWFSFLSHGLSTLFVLTARSSIVPGTATLINLLHQRKIMLFWIWISKRLIVKTLWKNKRINKLSPEKNSIFCNLEEIIGWRIDRKVLL